MATNKETIRRYNDEVEIIFYPDSHRYKVDGSWVKSVTGILGIINKPQLIPWAVNLAKAYLQVELKAGRQFTEELIVEACSAYTQTKNEATDVGKIIHSWIEEFVLQKISGHKQPLLPPENQQAANWVVGFLEWYNANQINFLFSEKLLYSRRNNYVGTADLGIELNGKRYLADIKSSKDIYAEYILQCIAYLEADEEETGSQMYDGIAILRFEKGTWDEDEVIEKPFDIFILERTDPLYKACHESFVGAAFLQKTLDEAQKLLKAR